MYRLIAVTSAISTHWTMAWSIQEPGGGAPGRMLRNGTIAKRFAAYQLANQLRIGSLAECGVEIHNSHFAGDGELFQPLERITAVQDKLLAAPQLYRASTHDVDARYDHRRTRIPRTARSALMPSTVSSPS